MNSNKFLFLVAFIVGLSIMAMEITASRILAPSFGTSSFVWTNVIGVVMAALSLGYWFGGRIADKKPELNLLLKLICGAGVFFLIIPFLAGSLSEILTKNILFLDSGAQILFIGSFLTTLFLYGIPMFLLGITSPFLIRLSYIDNKKNVGEVSGTIFAVSTAGSIIGTFLPTLILIPTIGTKLTIYSFASLLIFLSIIGMVGTKKRLFFLAVPLFFFFLLNPSLSTNANTVIEEESSYQFINIISYNGKQYFITYNEGLGVQSIVNRDKFLTGEFYDYASILPLMKDLDEKKSFEYLLVGFAGGTVANALNKIYEEKVNVTGVEIDGKMIKIAKELLGFQNSPTNIVNMDGRMFLKFNEKKYDFIYIDVYANEMYVPWTLSTLEFWESVKLSLNEGGVLGINLYADNQNSDFLKIITNTIAKEFNNTYGLWPIKIGSPSHTVFASDVDINFEEMKKRQGYEILKEPVDYFVDNYIRIDYSKDIKIFTDDWSPVEFLTDKILFDIRKYKR